MPPVADARGKAIKLNFSCRAIADKDTLSKSDPYIVLYATSRDGNPNNCPIDYASRVALSISGTTNAPNMSRIGALSSFGREIGRTEVIQNNLNPTFRTAIGVQFLFEERQDLMLVVYDDDGYDDDTKNDICGMVRFQLSHIVCSAKGRKEFQLSRKSGKLEGTVEISFAEVNANARGVAHLAVSGSGLPAGGFCMGSHPYFILSQVGSNGALSIVHKSETLENTTNPRWLPTTIPLHNLVGATPTDPVLLFELFTRAGFCGEPSLGAFRCSLQQLQNSHKSKLAFAPKKNDGASKRFGSINVEMCRVVQYPTFASSLASGWQINMALSIDFTGSNGNPRDCQSLHFMNPTAPNQYVSAMMSVGDILMEYDTDKQIPVYGFGANINGVTSHFFNVNGLSNPNVLGVQGALDAYGAFLPNVSLSGPTNFAPTIRAVTQSAREAGAERVYTILLIITDGEITDMAQTIDALVEADDAPLSIVIVGVGNGCDFQMMDELDGDGVRLRSSTGRVSRRDLVQFVPYRDFAPPLPRRALAAAVLSEIPDQFEEYFVIQSSAGGY